jgi:predicted Zn-dependent protease
MKKLVLLALVLVVLVGCAINPATGKRQLVLISDMDERKMGLKYDKSVVSEMGLYPDESLQKYVQQLGKSLAARSERPDLSWTFRVVDDPVVNAFAVPGGYIYVTRGILAHFNSEAELVAVLGHEIGHVTARHSVNQMSKAQLAQIGMVAGSIFAPETMGQFGQLAETGLGVLFLKFGRDDERQADSLGLRYTMRSGYDPRPMTEVFDMLSAVSRASGGGRVPAWLSTHPQPENRSENMSRAIKQTGKDFSGSKLERESYLKRIDGIVFGDDPRQGYFKDELFLHPEMKFRLRFPTGWKTRNQRTAVTAVSKEQEAALQLTLAAEETASAGQDKFYTTEGVSRVSDWPRPLPSLPTRASRFRASTQQGTVEGLAAFVEHDGKVFRLLGYAPQNKWSEHQTAVGDAIASFARLTDSKVLGVKPNRLKIVKVPSSMSLSSFASRYGSVVPVGSLAVLNNVESDARLAAGRSYKVVTGAPLP